VSPSRSRIIRRGRRDGSERSVKRYEMRWATLDPVQGSEIAQNIPVVIVSLDVLNERLNMVTVCPFTTPLHPAWRSRLQVPCGGKSAEIAADQIRTVAKSRIGKKIGALSERNAAALRRVLTEMYGG
jgi:mRNA interferase MazF